jgi:hypothetical protein
MSRFLPLLCALPLAAAELTLDLPRSCRRVSSTRTEVVPGPCADAK